jgi:hypothetical protein
MVYVLKTYMRKVQMMMIDSGHLISSHEMSTWRYGRGLPKGLPVKSKTRNHFGKVRRRNE